MEKPQYSYNPFAALLDAAVDGIIVINEEGVIQVVNPAVTRLFGYGKDQLAGRNVNMLMAKAVSDKHDGYIGKYLKSGTRKIIGIGREVIGKRIDQSYFPMYLSVGHIKGKDQSGFVGIIRDLTAQHEKLEEMARNEAEIRQLHERLVHVARISILGEMVTGIAHEVNQPLTAIASYAQGCVRMINNGLEDPGELLDALEKIDSQAKRAAKVITGIRQFSKKSPIVHESYDCNVLIAEVVALAEIHAAEKNVSLDLNLADACPLTVVVDVIQVQQVALNLINNAIESMDEVVGKKVVSIQTKVLDKDTIEVSVSDIGKGLDDVDEDQVFDAFFTTKSSGLGMGLSICQSLVNAQGGRIGFRRNLDKGCTFHFTLPSAVAGIDYE